MRLPKKGGSKHFAAFTGINSYLLYNEIQNLIMVTEYITQKYYLFIYAWPYK